MNGWGKNKIIRISGEKTEKTAYLKRQNRVYICKIAQKKNGQSNVNCLFCE
jgi:hypothetical protein